ncbi:hypothetical protein E2C01_012892 [Portunus trituberculatus]|uniref:Uncharacterized protein n=1 Tax=Portunus trituberculatus TaxID=210409 RepID=A0A5B7DFH4_PORTR|nr:hypothetical protein [Portunus trituberculatus]
MVTDCDVSGEGSDAAAPAHMSSTRAELYTVQEALHIVAPLHKGVYFFVDSQAALYTFPSTSLLILSTPQKVMTPRSIPPGYPHVGTLLNE